MRNFAILYIAATFVLTAISPALFVTHAAAISKSSISPAANECIAIIENAQDKHVALRSSFENILLEEENEDNSSTSTESNTASPSTGVPKIEERIRKLLSDSAAAVDNLRSTRNKCCTSAAIRFDVEQDRMAIAEAIGFYIYTTATVDFRPKSYLISSTDPFKDYYTVIQDFKNNLKEIEVAFSRDCPNLGVL